MVGTRRVEKVTEKKEVNKGRAGGVWTERGLWQLLEREEIWEKVRENSKGILEALSQLSYLFFERIRQGCASGSVVKNLPAVQETEFDP